MFSFWLLRVVRSLSCTRVINWDVRYSGAWPVMHLKAIVAWRYYSWSLDNNFLGPVNSSVVYSLSTGISVRESTFDF